MARIVRGSDHRWDSPQHKRLVGRGWSTFDYNANALVYRTGGTDVACSVRFRALFSGPLTKVQTFWKENNPSAGYAGGTGGVLRIRCYADNGSGEPNLTGTRYANVEWTVGLTSGEYTAPDDRFQVVTLTSENDLVAGQLYHLVFDNIDAAPQTNYVSINMAGRRNDTHHGTDHGYPFLSRNEYAALRGTGSNSTYTYSWTDQTVTGVPGETYTNWYPRVLLYIGTSWQGGLNSSYGNPGYLAGQWVLDSADPIRERVVPNKRLRISGASFYGYAQTAGDMTLELKEGSTVLATATITQSPSNESNNGSVYAGKWYHAAFDKVAVLASGTTYDLVATPVSSAVWRAWNHTNGKYYSDLFSSALMHGDAVCSAEYWNGSGWYGAENGYPAATNRVAARNNWMMLLHRAQAFQTMTMGA